MGAEYEGTNANTWKTCCYSRCNACMANWHRFIVHITIFSVFHIVPLPRIMWLCENFGLQLRKMYVCPLMGVEKA